MQRWGKSGVGGEHEAERREESINQTGRTGEANGLADPRLPVGFG